MRDLIPLVPWILAAAIMFAIGVSAVLVWINYRLRAAEQKVTDLVITLLELRLGEQPDWRDAASSLLPYTVLVDPELGWYGEVEAACTWWNEQANCRLFLYQGEMPKGKTPTELVRQPGTIVLTPRGDDCDMIWMTIEEGESRPIRVPADVRSDRRGRVITHTLGHVLNISCTENCPSSIMDWRTSQVAQYELPEEKKVALRAAYGGIAPSLDVPIPEVRRESRT